MRQQGDLGSGIIFSGGKNVGHISVLTQEPCWSVVLWGYEGPRDAGAGRVGNPEMAIAVSTLMDDGL